MKTLVCVIVDVVQWLAQSLFIPAVGHLGCSTLRGSKFFPYFSFLSFFFFSNYFTKMNKFQQLKKKKAGFRFYHWL